jgi:hypothetical protein
VRAFLRLLNLLLAALFTLNSSTATFIRKPDNIGQQRKPRRSLATPLHLAGSPPAQIQRQR